MLLLQIFVRLGQLLEVFAGLSVRLGLLLASVLDRKERLLDFVVLGHLFLGCVLKLTHAKLRLRKLS